VTAESASDLAAEPHTDDEIRSSPRAPDAFHWLTGAADAIIAWSGRHLRGPLVDREDRGGVRRRGLLPGVLELPRHQWAAVVSLLSLNYSVDFSGLQMNVSLIRPFPAQLVSTRGHLL
jgi:hypothetical protein